MKSLWELRPLNKRRYIVVAARDMLIDVPHDKLLPTIEMVRSETGNRDIRKWRWK